MINVFGEKKQLQRTDVEKYIKHSFTFIMGFGDHHFPNKLCHDTKKKHWFHFWRKKTVFLHLWYVKRKNWVCLRVFGRHNLTLPALETISRRNTGSKVSDPQFVLLTQAVFLHCFSKTFPINWKVEWSGENAVLLSFF